MAADNGKHCVKNRQAQNQERHHKRNHRIKFEQSLKGNTSQNIPQERGAGIAHENLGRIHVIGHKPDARTHQCRHDHRHLRLGHQNGNSQHGQRTDGTDADSQSIQPVNQIYGVRKPHNPNHSNGNRQPPKIPIGIVTEQIWIADAGDLHTVINGDQRRQNLYYKLETGPAGA